MSILRRRKVILLLVVSITLVGCGGKAAAPVASPAVSPETYAPVIDPASFVAKIDNPFFPLVPGTTFIYEGKTEKGDERNEVVVTSDTKVIQGVTCVVVQDTVLVDGKVEEATLDWYAQDKQGNVWYFGEDSKEYQDGKVVSTEGSWEAGVDGAEPGIIMKASLVVGDKYRQEYYQGEAEDWAEVLSLSESATVPTGSYQGVLLTNEWSALGQPPIYEHKYYAQEVGFIKEIAVKGGYQINLIEIRHE